MSGPNLSKDPGDGSGQPPTPQDPYAPDAGTQSPPPYDAAPPPGAPYAGSSYQSTPYAGAPYQGQYAGGGPGTAYAAPPATNAMALGSLIASVAGWTLVPFVGWIVGVVLGHIARSQLRQSNEQGAGLALAGLITGYVGLALSVLAVIAFVILAIAFGASSESW